MYLIKVSKHSPNGGGYFTGFESSSDVVNVTQKIMDAMVFEDRHHAMVFFKNQLWHDVIVWICFLETFNNRIRVMRDTSDILVSFRDYAINYSSRDILTAFSKECLVVCEFAGAKLTMRQTADIMCTMALAAVSYNIFKIHCKSWQGVLLMLFSIFEACELNVPEKKLEHDLFKRLFVDFMDDELNVLA